MIQLKNLVWKEGQYYAAQCLNVEISSFGDTKEQALKNLEEATSLYFEDNDEPEIHEVHSPELITTISVQAFPFGLRID